MSQGDMFLVNLDPTLHTEIGKTRPVLILSIDAMNAHLPRVLVAPVWSNVHKIYLHEVFIFECLKNIAEDLKWQQNDTAIRLGDTFDSREENKMTTTALNKLEVLKQAYPDEKELESVLGKLLNTALNHHRLRLERYQRDLLEFEQRYGMESGAFYHRFTAGQLGDAMDFFEWAGVYELREDLLDKIRRMEEAL